MQHRMFIELDVHKATILVAVAQGERRGEVRHWGTVPHRPDHVCKLMKKLGADKRRLFFCCEAGPCGYGMYRQLVDMGHECIVVPQCLSVRTTVVLLFRRRLGTLTLADV